MLSAFRPSLECRHGPPRMKSSVRRRASASVYCCGGDFMSQLDGP